MALEEAIKLAKDQSAVLRIVHVLDLAPAYTMMEGMPLAITDYKDISQKAADKLMANLASKLKSSGVNFDQKMEVIESFRLRISDVINRQADQWPAELVVIGTHGRRGFDRLLLGSVAEGIARTSKKPVLLIRSEEKK